MKSSMRLFLAKLDTIQLSGHLNGINAQEGLWIKLIHALSKSRILHYLHITDAAI